MSQAFISDEDHVDATTNRLHQARRSIQERRSHLQSLSGSLHDGRLPDEANNTSKLGVRIIKATGLTSLDGFFTRKSDPYCICALKGKEDSSKFKTKVINNDLNPRWDHAGELAKFLSGDTVKFEVWDADFGKRDSLIGSVEIPSSTFYPRGFEGDLTLKGAEGKTAGTISVHILPLAPKGAADEGKKAGTISVRTAPLAPKRAEDEAMPCGTLATQRVPLASDPRDELKAAGRSESAPSAPEAPNRTVPLAKIARSDTWAEKRNTLSLQQVNVKLVVGKDLLEATQVVKQSSQAFQTGLQFLAEKMEALAAQARTTAEHLKELSVLVRGSMYETVSKSDAISRITGGGGGTQAQAKIIAAAMNFVTGGMTTLISRRSVARLAELMNKLLVFEVAVNQSGNLIAGDGLIEALDACFDEDSDGESPSALKPRAPAPLEFDLDGIWSACCGGWSQRLSPPPTKGRGRSQALCRFFGTMFDQLDKVVEQKFFNCWQNATEKNALVRARVALVFTSGQDDIQILGVVWRVWQRESWLNRKEREVERLGKLATLEEGGTPQPVTLKQKIEGEDRAENAQLIQQEQAIAGSAQLVMVRFQASRHELLSAALHSWRLEAGREKLREGLLSAGRQHVTRSDDHRAAACGLDELFFGLDAKLDSQRVWCVFRQWRCIWKASHNMQKAKVNRYQSLYQQWCGRTDDAFSSPKTQPVAVLKANERGCAEGVRWAYLGAWAEYTFSKQDELDVVNRFIDSQEGMRSARAKAQIVLGWFFLCRRNQLVESQLASHASRAPDGAEMMEEIEEMRRRLAEANATIEAMAAAPTVAARSHSVIEAAFGKHPLQEGRPCSAPKPLSAPDVQISRGVAGASQVLFAAIVWRVRDQGLLACIVKTWHLIAVVQMGFDLEMERFSSVAKNARREVIASLMAVWNRNTFGGFGGLIFFWWYSAIRLWRSRMRLALTKWNLISEMLLLWIFQAWSLLINIGVDPSIFQDVASMPAEPSFANRKRRSTIPDVHGFRPIMPPLSRLDLQERRTETLSLEPIQEEHLERFGHMKRQFRDWRQKWVMKVAFAHDCVDWFPIQLCFTMWVKSHMDTQRKKVAIHHWVEAQALLDRLAEQREQVEAQHRHVLRMRETENLVLAQLMHNEAVMVHAARVDALKGNDNMMTPARSRRLANRQSFGLDPWEQIYNEWCNRVHHLLRSGRARAISRDLKLMKGATTQQGLTDLRFDLGVMLTQDVYFRVAAEWFHHGRKIQSARRREALTKEINAEAKRIGVLPPDAPTKEQIAAVLNETLLAQLQHNVRIARFPLRERAQRLRGYRKHICSTVSDLDRSSFTDVDVEMGKAFYAMRMCETLQVCVGLWHLQTTTTASHRISQQILRHREMRLEASWEEYAEGLKRVDAESCAFMPESCLMHSVDGAPPMSVAERTAQELIALAGAFMKDSTTFNIAWVDGYRIRTYSKQRRLHLIASWAAWRRAMFAADNLNHLIKIGKRCAEEMEQTNVRYEEDLILLEHLGREKLYDTMARVGHQLKVLVTQASLPRGTSKSEAFLESLLEKFTRIAKQEAKGRCFLGWTAYVPLAMKRRQRNEWRANLDLDVLQQFGRMEQNMNALHLNVTDDCRVQVEKLLLHRISGMVTGKAWIELANVVTCALGYSRCRSIVRYALSNWLYAMQLQDEQILQRRDEHLHSVQNEAWHDLHEVFERNAMRRVITYWRRYLRTECVIRGFEDIERHVQESFQANHDQHIRLAETFLDRAGVDRAFAKFILLGWLVTVTHSLVSRELWQGKLDYDFEAHRQKMQQLEHKLRAKVVHTAEAEIRKRLQQTRAKETHLRSTLDHDFMERHKDLFKDLDDHQWKLYHATKKLSDSESRLAFLQLEHGECKAKEELMLTTITELKQQNLSLLREVAPPSPSEEVIEESLEVIDEDISNNTFSLETTILPRENYLSVVENSPVSPTVVSQRRESRNVVGSALSSPALGVEHKVFENRKASISQGPPKKVKGTRSTQKIGKEVAPVPPSRAGGREQARASLAATQRHQSPIHPQSMQSSHSHAPPRSITLQVTPLVRSPESSLIASPLSGSSDSPLSTMSPLPLAPPSPQKIDRSREVQGLRRMPPGGADCTRAKSRQKSSSLPSELEMDSQEALHHGGQKLAFMSSLVEDLHLENQHLRTLTKPSSGRATKRASPQDKLFLDEIQDLVNNLRQENEDLQKKTQRRSITTAAPAAQTTNFPGSRRKEASGLRQILM